jgi:hypothetical protein
MPSASGLHTFQGSAFAAHGNGTSVDGQFADQKIISPVHGRRGSDDPNRHSRVQGRCRPLAQEGAEVSIHYALRASYQQMQASWATHNTLGDDFLNGSVEGEFTRCVVDRGKNPFSAGLMRRFGAKWDNCDREQQAS